MVLQRDPFCKWPGCFLPSTQADHVVPTSQGGARLDPANGQGLCDEHHTEKTWLENLEGAPVRAAGRVLVVSGPPGSGKSSYVARHRRDGDLVFDYDEIACALTGQRMYEYSDEVKRFVNATRRAIVAEVRRSGPRQKLWMIAGAPRSGERHRYRVELAAITVVLEVPPGECVRRIAADARRADQLDRWREAVEAWWAVYGPSPLDRVLKPAALPTRRAS